jgi:hypothetical protein
MNLKDFSKNSSSSKLNSLLESYNGNRIDFSKMTIKKASKLSRLLETKLAAKRNTVSGKGKQDKAMFEAYMMKSALDRWVFEQHRHLLEDEMKQAEVILAAKDIVDRLQSMTEDLSKLINEEMPPLGDSIRDTISADKSSQFVSSVTDLLNQVLDSVKQARQGVDSATRGLTGDATDMNVGAAAMPGEEGDVGGEEGFAGMGEPDMAMPAAGGEGDPFAADDRVSSIGRARR